MQRQVLVYICRLILQKSVKTVSKHPNEPKSIFYSQVCLMKVVHEMIHFSFNDVLIKQVHFSRHTSYLARVLPNLLAA